MINKTEQEIMRKWKNNVDKPLVSICCITYNHEKYIGVALDSFLMQNTDFSFEILINDDCSTDNTEHIIRRYEKEYPNIIKPIYQKENQYSKGITIVNATFNFPRAQGDYIAMCEGDDYWVDPLKLQKQVDFLKMHNEYSISYHDVNVIDDKGNIISKSFSSKIKDFSSDEMLSGDAIILTGTALFRNCGISSYPKIFSSVVNGDMTLWHILGMSGPGKFQRDVGNTCYRIHSGGVWSSIGQKMRIMKTIETLNLLKKNLPIDKKYLESKITEKIQQYHVDILHIFLRKMNLVKYSWYMFSIIYDKEVNTVSILKFHYKRVLHFFLLRMKEAKIKS